MVTRQSLCCLSWESGVEQPHLVWDLNFCISGSQAVAQGTAGAGAAPGSLGTATFLHIALWMRSLQNKLFTFFFFYINVEDEQGQGMKQKRKNIHSAPQFNVCFPGASIASLELDLQGELEGTDCSIFLSLGVLAWIYPVPPFTSPTPLTFLWKGCLCLCNSFGFVKKNHHRHTHTHMKQEKKFHCLAQGFWQRSLRSLCNPNPENCLWRDAPYLGHCSTFPV